MLPLFIQQKTNTSLKIKAAIIFALLLFFLQLGIIIYNSFEIKILQKQITSLESSNSEISKKQLQLQSMNEQLPYRLMLMMDSRGNSR